MKLMRMSDTMGIVNRRKTIRLQSLQPHPSNEIFTFSVSWINILAELWQIERTKIAMSKKISKITN